MRIVAAEIEQLTPTSGDSYTALAVNLGIEPGITPVIIVVAFGMEKVGVLMFRLVSDELDVSTYRTPEGVSLSVLNV